MRSVAIRSTPNLVSVGAVSPVRQGEAEGGADRPRPCRGDKAARSTYACFVAAE